MPASIVTCYIRRGSEKFLRDSGNYVNNHGVVLTDLMSRIRVSCLVQMTGGIVTAANELGARVRWESDAGQV